MLKRLILAIALCLPFSAHAVDFTITLSAADAARVLVAVGRASNLIDPDTQQPRAATQTEAKDFLAARLQQLIISTEGKVLNDAALKAVVIPAFTVQ